MTPLTYFAGFGPKDLMLLSYIPAIGVLTLCSLIFLVVDLIKKRRTRPYVLSYLFGYLFAYAWYAYDKFKKHNVDHAQAILLGGFSIVLAIAAIAATPLVPETNFAVNAVALFATVLALVFLIIANFSYRKKLSSTNLK